MDLATSPTSMSPSGATRLPEELERKARLVPSYGITVGQEPVSARDRPPMLKHVSTPAYDSPLRHHRRNPSTPRKVKESLNARSEYTTSQDDGTAEHRINQYIIKQEIGRGSFGACHLAVDQYGTEYAVKEFSKARLRKRAQSHILRQPFSQRRRGALAARGGFNSPLHRNTSGDGKDGDGSPSSIELIKEEIAIMKKLNHPNLASLIEVLDDPSEDSLYMVMEMCKKGVVMNVGLNERADPYSDDICRYWFRDLVLGIEYLHAQGVVHRDIKPDNCLITEDDVLKVVDFGVSEMFEKDSEMVTAKSAGSPAFLPPELCVAKHGDVSGKAADIWSMGVTLYCLKYGRIPFEKSGIFDLYDSIKTDVPDLDGERDRDFQDLMFRILEKDPKRRIKMAELREHPWVTKGGADPLLSEYENTCELVEPPTEAEMNAAITGNMRNLMTVVKAVNKFKSLTAARRPTVTNSILGENDTERFVQAPTAIQHDTVPLPHLEHKSRSMDMFDRGHIEGSLVADGVHREINANTPVINSSSTGGNFDGPSGEGREATVGDSPPPLSRVLTTESDEALSRISTVTDLPTTLAERFPPFRSNRPQAFTSDDTGRKGQARNPLEDHLYLFIGPSTFAGSSVNPDRRPSFVPDEDDVPVVSESPGAADVDIYETAYRDEIERIRARAKDHEKEEPAVFLTRRVDARLMALSGMAGKVAAVGEDRVNRFREVAQFRERKARVTDVSRALREAAKEEYARKRQERREVFEASRLERARMREAGVGRGEAERTTADYDDQPSRRAMAGQYQPDVPYRSSREQWKMRARDKGSRTKSSLGGFVEQMKARSRSGRE